MTPYSLMLANSGSQSIPDSTITNLAFNTIAEGSVNAGTLASDTDLLIAIPGLYLVTANAQFSSADGGTFVMQLVKQGGDDVFAQDYKVANGDPIPLSASAPIFFNAGDVLQVQVKQTSGGALSIGQEGFLTKVSIIQIG